MKGVIALFSQKEGNEIIFISYTAVSASFRNAISNNKGKSLLGLMTTLLERLVLQQHWFDGYSESESS